MATITPPTDPNPYQPPITDDAWVSPQFFGTSAKPPDEQALAAARQRLAQHVADARLLAQDENFAGGRLRWVTIVFFAITALLVAGAIVYFPNPDVGFLSAIFLVVGTIFLIGAVVALINDLRTGVRRNAIHPLTALKGWLLSAKFARKGYFFACLCPTAREKQAQPPAPTRYPAVAGPLSVADPKGAQRFLKTWARPGFGQVRWFSFRRLKLLKLEDDLAVVQVEVILKAWPQWANILSIVLFLVFRLLGVVVGLVLYLVLRRVAKVTVHKTLLRGDNGLWYVYDSGLQY